MTAASDTRRPATRVRRVRIVVLALLVVAVVVVVTVLLVARHRAAEESRRYDPLQNRVGGFSFFGPDPSAAVRMGGVGDRLHIVGPPGTEQRFVTALTVDGAHDVHIDSVSFHSPVVRVEWSPYVPGRWVSGRPQAWRPFPTTARAHSVIRLGIVVRKSARCPNDPSQTVDLGVTVRWHALDDSHESPFPIGRDYGLLRACA